MPRLCSRKVFLWLLAAVFTCLLLLLLPDQGQGQAGQRRLELRSRSLQSWESPWPEEEDGEEVTAAAPEPPAHSFREYFSELSRTRGSGRRLASPLELAATPQPFRDDVSAGDLFIAVKTTKKFHRARLELLLETWISRSREQ
eukprot:g44565.t1